MLDPIEDPEIVRHRFSYSVTQISNAILAMHADGRDIGELLALALARAAGTLGSSFALVADHPDSWETEHVRKLLAGTVGESDEALGEHR